MTPDESVKNDLERLARRWAGWIEETVARNAIARIEQLEEQIDLMKIQMQGDCGVCKHKAHDDACLTCLTLPDKPLWEYEGLPGA